MSPLNESEHDRRSTEVVVAILRDSSHRVLLCQRHAAARYGLKWEFPGGKVEPGETREAALRRELAEELGILVGSITPYHVAEVSYPDGGHFTVAFFLVERWVGIPHPRTAAALEWVTPEGLLGFDVLDGSRDVCRLLANE